MADPRARFIRIRNGLTPSEWARAGVMVAVIIGRNVLGWLMLAAAVGGRYHITGKEIFGFGTGILAYTLPRPAASPGYVGFHQETPRCPCAPPPGRTARRLIMDLRASR